MNISPYPLSQETKTIIFGMNVGGSHHLLRLFLHIIVGGKERRNEIKNHEKHWATEMTLPVIYRKVTVVSFDKHVHWNCIHIIGTHPSEFKRITLNFDVPPYSSTSEQYNSETWSPKFPVYWKNMGRGRKTWFKILH